MQAEYNEIEMYVLSDKDVKKLVGWYRKHKRSFPWRDSEDPYDVWISEIMLQQTRTEAVIPYFERFKKEVPDIQSLAAMDEDKLFRLWEGLGYYSRARNLKRCATVLVEQYDGKLIADYDSLLKLPGIGPYTAGAIMSIGFDQGYAAIDGNVLRVLARFFGIREDIRRDAVRKDLEETIVTYYKGQKRTKGLARDLSQAFMDLGATICIPNGKPLCESCPLKDSCYACQNDCCETLPYRSKNKDRKVVKRTLFILRSGETFLLRKRPSKGLLAGLYEFLGVDEDLTESEALTYLKTLGYDALRIKRLPDAKHIFSHVEWHMRAYEIQIGNWDVPLEENEVLVDRKKLNDLAIPSAFKTYIDYYALREENET